MSEVATDNTVVTEPVTQTAPVTTTEPAPVDWTPHIPKDLASEKYWEKFKGKGLSDVLKSGLEAERFIGGSIRLPNEKDKPEDAAKKLGDIYTKLGRPATAGEYKTAPKLPEGINFSAEHDSAFKAEAHKLGLSETQLEGVYGFFGKYLEGGMAEISKQAKADEATLKEEWGPNYPTNSSLATRALASVAEKALGKEGSEAFMDMLDKKGMGNNPQLVKIFAALGAEMKEDGMIAGDGDVSQEAIQTQLSDLTKTGTAFWDARHPDHDKAVADVERLRAMLNNPVLQR